MSAGTLDTARSASHFDYKTVTFSGWASQPILLCSASLFAVRTPALFLVPVWPLSRSLAATCKISVYFFSSAYLDVSVRRVPSVKLCIRFTVIRDVSYEVSPFGHP